MNLVNKIVNKIVNMFSSNKNNLDSSYNFYVDVYSVYMHAIVSIQANKVDDIKMLTGYEYNLDLPDGYILHISIPKCYVYNIVKLKGKFNQLVKYNLKAEVKYGSDVVSHSSSFHLFYVDENNERITIDSLEAFKQDASRLLAYLN